MKTLAMLALALAALYAALCLLVFATQRRQIYYPTVESHAAEADALRLPVQEAELKIWSIDRGGADALVYFGGNAEDVSANLAMLKAILPGYSLFLVNYRGYGGSAPRKCLRHGAQPRLRRQQLRCGKPGGRQGSPGHSV
jgi:hypothetical protein